MRHTHAYATIAVIHDHIRGDETHHHNFEKDYASCYWDDGMELLIEQILPRKRDV